MMYDPHFVFEKTKAQIGKSTLLDLLASKGQCQGVTPGSFDPNAESAYWFLCPASDIAYNIGNSIFMGSHKIVL